jgi:hypothetical protein
MAGEYAPNLRGANFAMCQPLYAMLAVLEIIGRRQEWRVVRHKKKKIIVDFCCLLWYIISVGKNEPLTTKEFL